MVLKLCERQGFLWMITFSGPNSIAGIKLDKFYVTLHIKGCSMHSV